MPEYIQESNIGGTRNSASVAFPTEPLSADFTEFSCRVKQLINAWDTETKNTEYRRRARNLSVNVQDLRTKGTLKPDESVIPVRLIDRNIKREQPARIAFLKQSPRLAIFKNPLDPTSNNQVIESEFTRVNQYPGWELPFFKCDDGAATHGWDALELELDYSLPGGFKFDHVGHDNLIFALDTTRFQANDIVIRNIPVTITQLKIFVEKYGFDKTQVEKVITGVEKTRETLNNVGEEVPQTDSQRSIYKVFNRENGYIMVSWYAKEADTWMLAPKPLFLGVKHEEEVPPTPEEAAMALLQGVELTPTTVSVDDYEKDFPFIIQVYEETEQRRIKDHKGRVFKDEYKQEAMFAIWSSYINACVRATNIMASPKNPMGGGAPKQNGNFKIEHGKLWTEPMDFWNLPYPEAQMLDAAQKLDVQNTEETNQVNYSVQNRQDSRKTAEEIRSANQQQSLINGVNVTMYSVFIRECCIRSWRLVQSFAQQGKITFCSISTPGEPGLDGSSGEPQVQNNLPEINKPWEIFAAGDADVVQRAEKSSRQLAMWPMIAGTPLAMTFLIDILKNSFPEDAPRYEQELRAYQQQQQQLTLMRNLQAAEIGARNGNKLGQMVSGQQPQQEQQTETASNV